MNTVGVLEEVAQAGVADPVGVRRVLVRGDLERPGREPPGLRAEALRGLGEARA